MMSLLVVNVALFAINLGLFFSSGSLIALLASVVSGFTVLLYLGLR